MADGPFIPVRVLTTREILTGNRNTKFRLDLLSPTDQVIGRLDGMASGKLDWAANAAVKGGGSLIVQDVKQNIDWLNARLRPVMLIRGLPEQNLGVFLPSEYPESYDKGKSWSVKLLDKTDILNQDTVAETYSVAGGSVVTTAVIALIVSSGITNYAVTASAATLTDSLSWDAGTSKLKIINDLLGTINYFSLYSNFDGQMVAEPYILPAARPIFYEFLDDDEGIFLPQIQRDRDGWSIPNRFTAVGQGNGTTAPLTSTVNNTNPASPYSQGNRGRVIGRREEGVEATSQAALDAYAARRLNELTTPTAAVTIQHSPVPGMTVNNVARFRRVPAGIDARHTVSTTSITLAGKALAETTLREVVDF